MKCASQQFVHLEWNAFWGDLYCIVQLGYIEHIMNIKRKRLVIISIILAALFGGMVGAQKFATSKIVARVQREMPNAEGVSASVPLTHLPSDLTSNLIRSVNIKIDRYFLKGSNTNSSLDISASRISKSEPTLVGSLSVTALVSTDTILQNAEFDGAQIVGDTLQVSVGAGGIGRASLVPKYSDGQIYFELASLSFMGNEIPASSLSPDLQDQIKSKSQRDLKVPKGLDVQSVLLSDKGLSLTMYGRDVQLGQLASSL